MMPDNTSLVIGNNLSGGAKRGNSRGVMTRRVRTDEQHEVDLVRIAELLTRECLSHEEIRQRLLSERSYKLSVDTISRDVKILMERWKQAYLGDIDELRGRKLRRIDNLEAAYWDSYERSLSSKEVTREEEEEGENSGLPTVAAPGGRFKKKKSVREMHQRDGSVQFLDGIKWCINQRCDILGLKAPLKSEMIMDWRVEAARAGMDVGRVFNDLVHGFIDGNIVESVDMKQIESMMSNE